MAKTTCKLCSRRFGSPRALAGHMRAHSIAAAKSQISSASSASTSVVVAGGGDDDGDACRKPVQEAYVLREKPKRRVRLAESDFSDRESEMTTGFLPSSSPSREKLGGHAGSGDAEPVSSVSDGTTEEEDVALSLIMLSRDSWWPTPPPSYRADSDDESADARPIAVPAQKRTKYDCSACKKVFRSYQALGGHRASNVRGGRGGCCAPPPSPMLPLPAHDSCGGEGASKPHQPHQCPHCFRVFPSGQALGGHRRSHHCSGAADPPVAMKSVGFIDLNLPPTLDDVELSAVSDPFLSSKPGP